MPTSDTAVGNAIISIGSDFRIRKSIDLVIVDSACHAPDRIILARQHTVAYDSDGSVIDASSIMSSDHAHVMRETDALELASVPEIVDVREMHDRGCKHPSAIAVQARRILGDDGVGRLSDLIRLMCDTVREEAADVSKSDYYRGEYMAKDVLSLMTLGERIESGDFAFEPFVAPSNAAGSPKRLVDEWYRKNDEREDGKTRADMAMQADMDGYVLAYASACVPSEFVAVDGRGIVTEDIEIHPRGTFEVPQDDTGRAEVIMEYDTSTTVSVTPHDDVEYIVLKTIGWSCEPETLRIFLELTR